MKHIMMMRAGAVAALLLFPMAAEAEILAFVSYETKSEESIRALRVEEALRNRRSGIAIIDVDPDSENFGKLHAQFPVSPGSSLHHMYYLPSLTKVYVTDTSKAQLHVLDLTRAPYRYKQIDIPECFRLDSVVFSESGDRWYVGCQQPGNIIIGESTTDQVTQIIQKSGEYVHGIAIHHGINRLLVTDSFGREARSEFGESITVFDPETMTELSRHKVSLRPSPARALPMFVEFVPGTDPPVAYVTTLAGGTESHGSLWAASWKPAEETFEVQELFDFSTIDAKLPIAMAFDSASERAFVTTAHPGAFHIFDISAGPLEPKLVRSLPCAQGAHHMAFSPDGRYVFVENGITGTPGMMDGSITVIDLENETVVGEINTLKDMGLTVNFILLLPEWHRPHND